MKRKTKGIKKTVRKSKWQLGWERTIKRIKRTLQGVAWMAIGAGMLWLAMTFWR